MSDFIPNIIIVDLDADIQKQFDSASDTERSTIAKKYILDNLRSDYMTNDGLEVIISGKTARKLAHTLYEPKIRVSPHLGEAIQCGVFEYVKESDKPREDEFVKFAYYRVYFDIGGKIYSGLLNIGIDKGGRGTLYDINPLLQI